MYGPGWRVQDSACVFLFELGVSRACSTRYVQPAVNRQPGYRWGDSDSWCCRGNLRFLRNVHSGNQKSMIPGTWAPRQVLTRQQGLDQMFVRLKSHAYPAGQYDLTSGYGAFKKNVCPTTRNLIPAVNRQP